MVAIGGAGGRNGALAVALAADYSNSIQVPCGAVPFPACPADFTISLRKGFSDFVDQSLGDVYEGRLFLSGREGAPTLHARPAICSLQPLPSNQCFSEQTKNRNDAECGTLAKLHFIHPPQYLYTLSKTRGHRETAWVAGLLLSAIEETAARMRVEMGENRLSLGVNSACQNGARDYFALTERIRRSDKIAALAGCRNERLVACTSQKYVDSAVEVMKAAYLQVARCVLLEESLRIARDYSRDFMSRVKSGVLAPCVLRCGDDPTCLPQCYTTQMPRWMRGDLAARFPAMASACPGEGEVR